MAKHVWSVLCERVLEDSVTKTVSFVELIEAINVHSPPPIDSQSGMASLPVRMQLVSYWTRSDESIAEEFDLRATALLPNGKSVSSPGFRISISKFSHRQNVTFPNLPYAGPGRYWIRVEWSKDGQTWQLATELPIEVQEQAVSIPK
jgi:hypothetical protein